MFLTFVISLIKHFDINGSSDFVSEVVLIWHSRNLKRQSMLLDQIERSRFRRIYLGHAINFKLYRIRKIDGALSHQKVCRKNKEVESIFEM